MSLILELYGKISDFDGTAELEFRYTHKDDEKSLKESES